MKNTVIFLLGLIAGVILSSVFSGTEKTSEKSNIRGLELFENPSEYLNYSKFKIADVYSNGCAIAYPSKNAMADVFIIPEEGRQFYDYQEVVLKDNQRALRVGTYRKWFGRKTMPAIRIVEAEYDGSDISSELEEVPYIEMKTSKNDANKTLFDKPGKSVSRRNFEVQSVLSSGDAIAKEITYSYDGMVLTSELEVLLPAQKDDSYYDKQIVKVPSGKCARQIGTYKYQRYGISKVIPIVEIR